MEYSIKIKNKRQMFHIPKKEIRRVHNFKNCIDYE